MNHILNERKWLIWDDASIDIFRDIESSLKGSLSKLGIEAEITRELDHENAIYFILNPHHTTFAKKARAPSNIYIGWDLANIGGEQRFKSTFQSIKLDALLVDCPEKKDVFKGTKMGDVCFLLEPTIGFYNIETITKKSGAIGFVGFVDEATVSRANITNGLAEIFGDRFVIINKYGQEKFDAMAACKYLIDIQRYDYFWQRPDHLRLSFCFQSNAIPISVKTRQQHNYSLMVSGNDTKSILKEIANEIEMLDRDDDVFAKKLREMKTRYTERGLFPDNLARALEDIGAKIGAKLL